MSQIRVVLASASPRRRELLGLIGIAHDVRPANVPEQQAAGESPAAYVERLARTKAGVVAAVEPSALVIGADTTVVLDGRLLEKPVDAPDAERMLRLLSGRSHVVMTAVAVSWQGALHSAVEQVGVTFRAITDAEVREYVATGEPLDKAGGYGIQGFGATIVERVDGDYFSVMGLGLRRVVALVEQAGLRYEFRRGVVIPA